MFIVIVVGEMAAGYEFMDSSYQKITTTENN